MSRRYRGEMREIVVDFVRALERRKDVDPYFLREIKELAKTGKLAHNAAVEQALGVLDTTRGPGGGDDED